MIRKNQFRTRQKKTKTTTGKKMLVRRKLQTGRKYNVKGETGETEAARCVAGQKWNREQSKIMAAVMACP
jgi:hypothetical protein